MNILFYHTNAIQPIKGGISKITFVLGELFQEHGHIVHYVSAKPYTGEECLVNQHFLEKSKELESLIRIVQNYSINIIINQFNFQPRTVDMIYECKQKCRGLKIVSCYHNSILTPIYNIAYQRELPFKMKHLGFLYHLLKQPLFNKIIVAYYIKKYRADYLRVHDKSDRIVLLCNGQKDEFVKMSGIKELSKLNVIYDTYSATSDEIDLSTKQKQVIWVGTFDFMVKRPDYLLKAWAKIQDKHSDWNLLMLGDGPAMTYMKSLSDSLHLKNITFTGRVHPEEYYKTASIHIVTSTHECFSMVTLEAKAFKCASILPSSFTSAELLIEDSVNGLLIEPFSVSELALALDKLMHNENDLRRMQINAYKSLNRFNKDIIYNSWSNLFTRISN
jgi:glycosyltransferase involved in cell wall biosynthesis